MLNPGSDIHYLQAATHTYDRAGNGSPRRCPFLQAGWFWIVQSGIIALNLG